MHLFIIQIWIKPNISAHYSLHYQVGNFSKTSFLTPALKTLFFKTYQNLFTFMINEYEQSKNQYGYLTPFSFPNNLLYLREDKRK